VTRHVDSITVYIGKANEIAAILGFYQWLSSEDWQATDVMQTAIDQRKLRQSVTTELKSLGIRLIVLFDDSADRENNPWTVMIKSEQLDNLRRFAGVVCGACGLTKLLHAGTDWYMTAHQAMLLPAE